jgi:hypothetical protein
MAHDVEEEWLSAAEAVQFTVRRTGVSLENAILERARDGLISARANRFIVEGPVRGRPSGLTPQTSDGYAVLPKDFFWAGANEALSANWVAGDFRTWVNSRWECRAYGVEFRTADIVSMCPQYVPRGTDSKSHISKHTMLELSEWIEALPLIKGDSAFQIYRLDPRFNGVKQEEFRRLWTQIKGTTPGRQPKNKA